METDATIEPVPVAVQPVETVAPVEAAPVPAVEPVSSIEESTLAADPSPVEQAPVSIWKQLELATSWEQRLEISKAAFFDLFSERVVQLKQVDVTTIALQGAASGIATMGVLFLLLRPHQM